MTNEHLEITGTGRRTVVRTAAWSVPAVTVATAAPAFAATPQADLSTSTANMAAVTRAAGAGPAGGGASTAAAPGSKITIPGGTVTFKNTGGTPAEGIVATMSITSGTITEVYGLGQPSANLSAFGVIVTGLGTPTVTITVPGGLLTIPADGSDFPLNFELALDTTDQAALDLTVSVDPANGGTGVDFDTKSFPALPADLSNSTADMDAVTRAENGAGSKITIPGGTVTFKNTGGTPAEGIAATMSVTSGTISEIYGLGQPSAVLVAFGVTTTGLGTSEVTINVPGGLLTIPADGTDFPLGFDLALDTTDQAALDFVVEVAPANGGTSVTFPAKSFPGVIGVA